MVSGGFAWIRLGPGQQRKKEKWGEMIKGYLLHRANLACVFVLIDSRLDPQLIDLDFLQWLGNMEIPFVLVFTKADKQSINKTQANISKFRKKMHQHWEEVPTHFITSAAEKSGKEDILKFIEETNNIYKEKN
jgi:GTP-binding protein